MIVPTRDLIRRLAPGAAELYLEAFVDAGVALAPYGVLETPLRLQHFLVQILHETGGLTVLRECMVYKTAPRLLEIFGERAHSAAVRTEEVAGLLRNPQALAERVYGLGNPKKAKELGNTMPGDGFAFRGGGPLQLTGRAAYAKYGTALDVDLVSQPELVIDPRHSLRLAAAEWAANGCNAAADRDDVAAVRKRVNGGSIGLPECRVWLAKVKAALPG